MTYFTSSTICGAQLEAKLHIYLHQFFSGPKVNQVVSANPNPKSKNWFGLIAINDWTIREGREPGSKVIARAQGMHVGSGQNKEQWYCTFSIIFDDECLKGSTLEVRGVWELSSPIEWAIVGGTGLFTLAQGVVRGIKLSEDDEGRIVDLSIKVFYRTLEK